MTGSNRKGKQPAKGGTSRKKSKDDMRAVLPGFHPTVSPHAGPSASGVRVGFPANRTVDMNYCSVTSMTGTSGLFTKVQYRLNSAFDPDFTATGHQPSGFDQWSLFYNHYVVEECSYDAVISSRELTANYVGAHLSDDNTVPSTVEELTELGSQTAYYKPYGPGGQIFKGKVDIGRFMNRPNVATDSELRATVGANPAEVAFLTLWGISADGSSSITFDVAVTLRMRIRFMEPKDLGSSAKTNPALKPPEGGPPCEYDYVRVPRGTSVVLPPG